MKDRMSNAEFNGAFRERTRLFAVVIFRFLDALSPGISSRNIAYQLGRSASSVGANFRAFCRGRSKKEKFAKICIVVEEADETEYWLQIVRDLQLGDKETIEKLLIEIDEIIRIVSSIKSSLRT
ncbi:MAG: four helix bundle protein [Proteobacteria bacterium]|nr:four helix bundle protein [Pseudomonadota bacterium]